jgi:superfamily II DNA or RNA helicase
MTYEELLIKYEKLKKENIRLRAVLKDHNISFEEDLNVSEISNENSVKPINSNIKSINKVSLFRSLFVGRSDVVAKQFKYKNQSKVGYTPYCKNDWKYGVCPKKKGRSHGLCKTCSFKDFVSYSDSIIKKHLKGELTLGIYPMLDGDYAKILVIDFDKEFWKEEVLLLARLCDDLDIPYALERSRSGDGAHLWFFFEKKHKASKIRKFGFSILNQAMQKEDIIKFSSYDRIFPNQDFIEKEGFGNLIALPFQNEARLKDNSVFVDLEFKPYENQWEFLSSVSKIDLELLEREIEKNNKFEIHSNAGVDGVLSSEDFETPLKIILSRGLTISKKQLSPKAVFIIRKLASYSNSEFYKKQKMRQSTFNEPRVIDASIEEDGKITIPRGLSKDLFDLLDKCNVKCEVLDERILPETIDVSFKGELRMDQDIAFQVLEKNDCGVLSASTGFGKTVIGSRLITSKKVPTLILVNNKELALQWEERLETFLDMPMITDQVTKTGRRRKPIFVGRLGGGKDRLTGRVDIALMQSMSSKDKTVKDLIHNYGMITVDECHRVPSVSYTNVLFASDARYVYGLTATPIRSDGHRPIIFMQCGPIRYTVDAKSQAVQRGFEHIIVSRFTPIQLPVESNEKDMHITEFFKLICESEQRNKLIVKDIIEAVNDGRTPLVLSERTSQLDKLYDLLKDKDFEVVVLKGSLKSVERKEAFNKLKNMGKESFVLLATGKLVGEGFDLPRLDTLFLAQPISFKGKVSQYAGRLHRNYAGKNEVKIYDYIDVHIHMFERMYHRRLAAYKSIGYTIRTKNDCLDEGIYDVSQYFELLKKDIEQANERIVIESKSVDLELLGQIKTLIVEKFNSGIKIILITSKYHRSIVLDELEHLGVRIIYTKGYCRNYVSIDNKILWYGGIVPIGKSNEDDYIIRLYTSSADAIFNSN